MKNHPKLLKNAKQVKQQSNSCTSKFLQITALDNNQPDKTCKILGNL